MDFQGYSPETFDFLWGLRFNNNREWFMEHKKDYVNYLYEPTKALGAALYAPFADVSGLGYKVSRIYKDVRFSKGDPYKESLWISIRRQTDSWDSEPTLYFEVSPEGCHYGLVYWRPKAAIMQAFRQELTDRPELYALIVRAEEAAGCTLEGDEYVRKKFEAPRPELERLYHRKGFWASVQLEPGELMFSKDLTSEVLKTLQGLLPLCQYFQTLASSYRDA